MPSFYYFWVLLVALSLVASTIDASFAYCVAIKTAFMDPKTVVGFQLFNDRGDTAKHYRSVYYAHKTELANNGWKVKVDLSFYEKAETPHLPDALIVSHTHHGENLDSVIYPLPLCQKFRKGGTSWSIVYRCIDNMGSGFCNANEFWHQDYCRTHLDMGTDTVTC
ncbi:hypothetical protein BX616_008684 [Lobosporangium transversale]|uniref:Secreted protein n=1 Tax=Lobosporangium transversale TaxID=64571 RepID=A0A1Y2GIK6_9FUNG|nr:hypothetical protein BCR41DRAFT_372668 [Lobosporangium transversale]KAF9914236.1 hypothetical protein BX616_008684 [Lobosporangium transversale]ORZ10073.1 hypothetical protein BCR41DRAFT_372668 [Lobosporangium transversale]|eukprot:XP_021879163.1 hypothetical protein BCR41DRAFT_372668 [Lobosporangium transversale]